MVEITPELCKSIIEDYMETVFDPLVTSEHSKMLTRFAKAWLMQHKEIEQLKEKIEELTPCPLCNNEGEVAVARGTGELIPASHSHAEFVLVYDCPTCAEKEAKFLASLEDEKPLPVTPEMVAMRKARADIHEMATNASAPHRVEG